MRYRLLMLIAICAVAIFVMPPIIGPVHANEGEMQATVGKPATIAISGKAERPYAEAGGRVVVTITGYEPSTAGSVTVVVSVRCGDDLREIGRFGIFPDVAFSVSAGAKPQQFGFPLPIDPACRQPQSVTLHVEPQAGTGVGASIAIGSASIE